MTESTESKEMMNMARPEVSLIEVKIEGQQLEFLEKRAKELGISKEELVKVYIAKAIDAECGESRFSLEGLFKEGPPIAKEVIDEVIDEWSKMDNG